MKKISMFIAILAANQLCAMDEAHEYYFGELKAYGSPLSLVSILDHLCTTDNQGQIASSLKTVLHEQQKSIAHITLPYGNVLHIAARTSGKILQFFLSNFSDESASMISAINEDGQTPLLDAVFFEEIDNAEILLSFIKEKKQQLMLKNNENKCALDLTQSGDMRKVLKKFLPVMSQEDQSELLNYCQQNHLVSALPRLFCQCEPEKAKEILLTVLRETQASIGMTSQKQKNALHVASKQNDLEMFKVIFGLAFELNEGWAILSAQDKKGRTPLHTAAFNGDTILIDANHKAAQKIGRLLELQTIKDNEGKTAGELERENEM